ncbi:MAG: HRDC domain-containing protein [Anaerolinea sp.]|nr:HRDC domain-containing protein [Anaerolinea sp.]
MSKHRPLPIPVLVETTDKLRYFADRWATERLIAFDTESNSLYAYRERVCLIQVSTRKHDYIVDPLRIPDMQPLAPLFADPGIEKVFHAAEYDLMCLKRDYGFTFANLFDTMIAARICGYKQVGLGALIGELFDVEVDKSHQRDNWGARPIPQGSLLYAQMDTHFLPALRDHFVDELARLSRWDEAAEAFRDAAAIPAARRIEFDPEGYWKIALPNQLTRRQTAILRELYLWREESAQNKDVPPFKIAADKTLHALAVAAPVKMSDIEGFSGLGGSIIRNYGRAILEAVDRGKTAKIPQPPAPDPAPDPRVVDLYTALREWRKNRALQRGVESDVIISKDALWSLAEHAPKTLDAMGRVPGMSAWRVATYGAEILEVIQKFPSSA